MARAKVQSLLVAFAVFGVCLPFTARADDFEVKIAVSHAQIAKGDTWDVEVTYVQESGWVKASNPLLHPAFPGHIDIVLLSLTKDEIIKLVATTDFPVEPVDVASIPDGFGNTDDPFIVRSDSFVGRRFRFVLDGLDESARSGNPAMKTCRLSLPLGKYVVQAIVHETFDSHLRPQDRKGKVIAKSAPVEVEVLANPAPSAISPVQGATIRCELIADNNRFRSRCVILEHRVTNDDQFDRWVYNPFLCQLADPMGLQMLLADSTSGKERNLLSLDGSRLCAPSAFFYRIPPGGICGRILRLPKIDNSGNYSVICRYDDRFISDPPKYIGITLDTPVDLREKAIYDAVHEWYITFPGKPAFEAESQQFEIVAK